MRMFACGLYDEHPEWRCVDWDGTPISRLSIAFPGVRRYFQHFRETVERGADGVCLTYCRGWPLILFEKPVALFPPPRFHIVRYHGILGPCASERCRVVPGAATEEAPPGKASIDLAVEPPGTTEGQRNEVDIPDRCSSLGQERHPPDVTQAILDCLVLPSRAPPTAAAAPSPDEWDEGFEATL